MGDEPLGHIIDALGCTHEPEEGELMVSAVVLIKVITADGREAVRFATSEGMGFIERIGLLEIALHMEKRDLGSEGDA